jgi:hypothetical protein
MSRTQPSLLRTAAEQSLARTFSDLTPSKLDELAVSMVRQWTTCNGTAVVMTRREAGLSEQTLWDFQTRPGFRFHATGQTISPNIAGFVRERFLD